MIIGSMGALATIAFFTIVGWGGLLGFTRLALLGPWGQLVGAALGLLAGLVIAVITTGIVFLLLSINEHLAALRETLGRG